MEKSLSSVPTIRPPLDEAFEPASLWLEAYRRIQDREGVSEPLKVCLTRPDGTVSVFETTVLPQRGEWRSLNRVFVERLVKTLLWCRGGYKVTLAGDPEHAAWIREVYRPGGAREFDHGFMGKKIYLRPFEVEHRPLEEAPEPRESTSSLGRHMDGCRVGFDLGGSDRKCAAMKDGEVVFMDEVPWDPYFQSDPRYHYEGIDDSIKRAAAHLPRVDAIGGSAAGVYMHNEVRAASLFRGVSQEDFDRSIRRIFFDLKEAWGGVPFEVVNDGEVTALAGSMSLGETAILGIAMGTSQAAGFVTEEGRITDWLNELAFVPVEFREDAPRDEWSGDRGCGVQYFSQQAVGRLIGPAGLEVPAGLPLPEKLVRVQEYMAAGDERARKIYETVGVYFGYAVAWYREFYPLRNVLLLGRVASGPGGGIILDAAKKVLEEAFPAVAAEVTLRTPGEKEKRLGQAVAAATLPRIEASKE